MAKVKVYRVGKVEVGQHNVGLQSFWGRIDAIKPASHPTGRLDAIYVSPNLHGMHRWLRSALMTSGDIEVHEITVDSEKVYAYEIDAYERVSASDPDRYFNNYSEKFWDTGMLLDEWLSVATEEDGHDTEILLAPEAVISSKKMSYTMVVNRMKKIGLDESDAALLKRRKRDFI